MTAATASLAVRCGVRRVLALSAVCLLAAAPVSAQTTLPGDRGPRTLTTPRTEVGVSGLVGGPVAFGETSADLRRPDGGRLPLFESDGRQGPEFGGMVHVSFQASRRFGVEAAASVSRARFETTIRDDLEGAAGVTIGEEFYRFTAEGGLVWTVGGSDRRSWFVRGTGGWMRELIGGNVLGEHAAVANLGVGMKYWGVRRQPGRVRYGFRVEGHVAVRWKGAALDARQIHLAPVLTAGFIIGS